MVPQSILQNLAGLRRRERLLTFAWGIACFVAIVLFLLLFCGFVDWWIDRDRDTPFLVRAFLAFLQVGVWVLAGFLFLVWPQLRRMPDESLALSVESKLQRFDHRLISAVQLNQPDANLGGMSKELVGVMTREAEKEAQRHGFARLADHTRLGWGAGLLAPVFLIFVLPFLIFPGVSFALLARQTLVLDVEIPRSVHLVSQGTPEVWPIGETIPIRFRVTGKFTEDMVGRVTLRQERGPTDHYELTFIDHDGDGAIFGADVPGASSNLRYTARLWDGRTRAASEVRVVPRPVIIDNQAWIILPAYCGTRPDGSRYERQQVRGDVVAIPGSGVRVQFEVQRPIKDAWLELKGVDRVERAKGDDRPILEIARGKIPMRISKKVAPATEQPIDIWQAEASFDLTEGLTSYTMGVTDVDNFDNVPQPRRALRVVPEDPPQVTLLKDTFDLGEGSTFDLEGLPVVLGRQIRIPYRADGAYGLGKVRIWYRALKKHESGEQPQDDEEWTKLDMPEVKDPGAAFGPFDPRTGVFDGMKYNQQVSFYAIPSVSPETMLGRTTGGGRYFLETKDNALIDSKGKPLQLKTGDQIEYCVEVFAMKRVPEASTPSARSESRVATMMSQKEFESWISSVSQEDERVRLLAAKQKGVFERK